MKQHLKVSVKQFENGEEEKKDGGFKGEKGEV